MKKNYFYLLILILPAVLLLFSFHTGSPGGYSGSPMDNRNCTQCHTTFTAEPINGWVSSDIPSTGYVPGETYTMTVTANDLNAVRFGFELTAESGDSKIGTFTITDMQRTQLTNGDHAVTHTANGIDPVGHEITWSVNWTAPEDAPEEVVFYAAVNAANGNGQNSDDLIYLTDTAFQVSTVGIADNWLARQLNVYPNPASSFVNLSLPATSDVSIINMLGQQVFHKDHTTSTEKIDLTEFARGVYFVQVRSMGSEATIRFIKN